MTRAAVTDVLPFVNRLARYRIKGSLVRAVLEQSLTLVRAMMQV